MRRGTRPFLCLRRDSGGTARAHRRGLVAAGPGWFVVNARDARWAERQSRGALAPLTGWSDEEAEAYFPQLGVNVFVLRPGEPMSMYHGEISQEDFLVLAGECVLIVEGEERRLERWDFVHCPPWTNHTIVGAGDGPCVVLAAGARILSVDNPDWGGYTVDDAARRHDAGVEVATTVPAEAYARFAPSVLVRYRDGLLPD